MKKETYIANGRKFKTLIEVENYAKENGFRIVNTETIRKNTFLIDLRLIDRPETFENNLIY